MMTLRLHARAIAWIAGLATITLTLGAIGILQTVTVGDPVAWAGTIVDIPSSRSMHVRVLLDSGDAVLVPREQHHGRLVEGDPVTVLETGNALSGVGYRLTGDGR